MTDVIYLELEDLLSLTRRLGAGPIRDIGLLDAACARPRASAFGQDAYPDLHHKAAALLHSVAGNHALVDGNKRLAWLATVVFLDLNGVEVTLSDDAAFELVVRVAEGKAAVQEIASALAGPGA
ncbi:type II toxin-antitoxin system death-on-curing family toxin [soil metagenome]